MCMYDCNNNFYPFISVGMRLGSLHCVVPEDIHTYPEEDDIDWKFQGREGGLKADIFRSDEGVGVKVKSAYESSGSSGRSLYWFQ